jgi:hypothetical protein
MMCSRADLLGKNASATLLTINAVAFIHSKRLNPAVELLRERKFGLLAGLV